MRCPRCGNDEDKVLDSRSIREGAAIRRRRECTECGCRFTTHEEIDRDEVIVVKRDGRRQSFDRRKLEKGVRVNALVEKACAGVDDPTDDSVAAFYAAHRSEYGGRTLVDAHDEIKDLLRHEARGRAMDAFVAELRAGAKIAYKEIAGHACTCGHDDGHGCSCGHDHDDGHECSCGHGHDDGHECSCGHRHG